MSTSFRIAVNAEKEQLIRILRERYKEMEEISANSHSFVLKKHHVVMEANADYDEKLAGEGEDGFLHYENNLDFHPNKDGILLAEQIQLAKEITNKFVSHGILAEIVAEFEDQL